MPNPFDTFEFPSIPHYYGDVVRSLFIAAAVLMIVGAPFYLDSLAVSYQAIVVGAIVVVGLAAITNPRTNWIAFCDSIVSAVGLGLYANWAFEVYIGQEYLAFVLRSAIAVLFLFTFYFSMKTVRAMLMHQVGKKDKPGEY